MTRITDHPQPSVAPQIEQRERIDMLLVGRGSPPSDISAAFRSI